MKGIWELCVLFLQLFSKFDIKTKKWEAHTTQGYFVPWIFANKILVVPFNR